MLLSTIDIYVKGLTDLHHVSHTFDFDPPLSVYSPVLSRIQHPSICRWDTGTHHQNDTPWACIGLKCEQAYSVILTLFKFIRFLFKGKVCEWALDEMSFLIKCHFWVNAPSPQSCIFVAFSVISEQEIRALTFEGWHEVAPEPGLLRETGILGVQVQMGFAETCGAHGDSL